MTLLLNMQCFVAVIFVLLAIQNTSGQVDYNRDSTCDPAQGSAVEHYMRRLNDAENDISDEADTAADAKGGAEDGAEADADAEDPEGRFHIFRTSRHHVKSKVSYFPSSIITGGGGFEIQNVPGFEIFHPGQANSVGFQFSMSSNAKIMNLFNTIKYKANASMEDILQRFFKLFIGWSELKMTLQISHKVSFREVMRAMFQIMYPEWGDMKLRLIFNARSDEELIRELFLAMFPNWPRNEVDDMFSVGNTPPLVLKKILQCTVPDITPAEYNFIFENTNSMVLILRRIYNTLFPNYSTSQLDYMFNINISILDLFERLLQTLFSTQPSSVPVLPPNIYDIIFPGISLPSISFNYSSPEASLTFILTQLNMTRTMPNVSFKRDKVLIMVLLEWLKMNPQLVYDLPAPGQDDFEHFRNMIFKNFHASMPWEFRDVNFLRDLFKIWKQYILIKFPSNQHLGVADIIGYIIKFLAGGIDDTPTTKPIDWPIPTPAPEPNPTTSSPGHIPVTITTIYIERLLILPTPMRNLLIRLFNLPNREKSFSVILNLVAEWSRPGVRQRISASQLFEIILKIVAREWPESEIRKVVGSDQTVMQIIINLFRVMFLDWSHLNSDINIQNLNSPKLILELFIKKALPRLPKPDVDAIFMGTNDLEIILTRIFYLMFPQWPKYDYFLTHFEPAMFGKVITEIASWPKHKSLIISKGVVSVPVLLESLLITLFPSWSQIEITMIVSGRTPLPLVIQKTLQLLSNGSSSGIIVYNHHTPKIRVPEVLFKKIFPDWPNFTATLYYADVSMQKQVLYELLQLLQSRIATILRVLQCLQIGENKWIAEFLLAIIHFLIRMCLRPY